MKATTQRRINTEGKKTVLALFFMGDQRQVKDGGAVNCPSSSPFVEPIVIPIEDHLDLHPFQPKEISSVVEEYLEQCRQIGLRQVRLIHGKGKGVQRNIIRALLQGHGAVAAFHDAPIGDGSWGATVVILKS